MSNKAHENTISVYVHCYALMRNNEVAWESYWRSMWTPMTVIDMFYWYWATTHCLKNNDAQNECCMLTKLWNEVATCVSRRLRCWSLRLIPLLIRGFHVRTEHAQHTPSSVLTLRIVDGFLLVLDYSLILNLHQPAFYNLLSLVQHRLKSISRVLHGCVRIAEKPVFWFYKL